MSYIRSTSNPERLYIWGGMRGDIEIAAGFNSLLHIPRHVFHGVLRRWYDRGDDITTYRGATMTLTDDFQYELTYKKWRLDQKVKAFDVTWTYIVRENGIDNKKVS
jgi:hypothetical protein